MSLVGIACIYLSEIQVSQDRLGAARVVEETIRLFRSCMSNTARGQLSLERVTIDHTSLQEGMTVSMPFLS